MSAVWKTVRVFISSTFRDMHAERDWLVKRVFPALRERLQKYRIHLIDIDLRWGITEEEAQNDRVLDLCLQQIDESRPFFVGILGERYGWVPESFTEDAADKYGWFQHQTGKSVTELEILYGVLRDIKMHERGLFFFRDPTFIEELPKAKRGDFQSENQASAHKLASLKQAIRETPLTHPPFENYPCRYAGLRVNRQLANRELTNPVDRKLLEKATSDGIIGPDEYAILDGRVRQFLDQFGLVYLSGLEEFGDQVLEGLWRAIKCEYGLSDMPPGDGQAVADPLAEEAAYHEDFMETRLRVYVGRRQVQEQLMAFACDATIHPCLVSGPSGSGKSSAMARFVRGYADTNPDAVVIPHFVGASPGSTNLRYMLRRFCLELQRHCGPTDEVPQDVGELAVRFRQALYGVPSNVKVLVVIDALNQLDETDNACSMFWLPWELPPHVKLVVSCVDDSAKPTIQNEPMLHALAQRNLARIELEPLTDNERLEIVSRVPSLSAKKLDPKQLALLLANPATTNPLFLLVALEELRGFGAYEQVSARIAAFPQGVADPIGALFGQVIERLRDEFDPDVVRMILALIASSRSGMSQRELLEMIEGIGVETSNGELFYILRQLRPYLQYRGALLDFFHRGLYNAVREWYLPDEDCALPYHADLADYFYRKLNPPNTEPWSGNYVRSLTELAHHQIRARQWGLLESTLTALSFLETKTAAGLVFELIGDVFAAWEALPDDRPNRHILWLLYKALRRDVHFVARHATDYPQGLFQCLWNTCWWYDCEDAAPYYKEQRSSSKSDYKSDKTRRNRDSLNCTESPRLCRLLEHWRCQKEVATPNFTWFRANRPPSIHLGSAQLAVFPGNGDPLTRSCFSPDGLYIASASTDSYVHVWSALTGKELTTLAGHKGAVASVAYSPSGEQIVSASQDGTVRVWNAMNGTEVIMIHAHKGHYVNDVAYSPDGRRIISGSADGCVRLWDAVSGDNLAGSYAERGGVTSVCFSPDGRRYASGHTDGVVRIWDAENGRALGVVRGRHRKRITSLSYSPDGRQVASASDDGTIRLWDAQNGVEVNVLSSHKDSVLSISYSPDGRHVASGSRDKTVRLWDAHKGEPIAVFLGHDSSVVSTAYSPNGRWIASSADDSTMRIWDAQGDGSAPLIHDHKDLIYDLTCSPDGQRIATASGDHTGRIWDARSGIQVAVLYGHNDVVEQVVYSPDGSQILTRSRDNTARLYNAQNGSLLAVISSRDENLQKVEYSYLQKVEYSPNGRWITTCLSVSDNKTARAVNRLRIWDARTGREAALSHGFLWKTTCVCFSPDGRRIATGATDNRVRVWDAHTGAKVAVFRGHKARINAVAYAPDSLMIYSDSDDKTVHVWDAKSGKCLEVKRGYLKLPKPTIEDPTPNLRFTFRGEDFGVELASEGRVIAWFPQNLRRARPGGPTWVGWSVGHLCIATLEGGLESERPAFCSAQRSDGVRL
ncbi:MAG: DUF4062 domain-containing protein [Rhodopirellula sp.]|nr:DUF4062 domain-containing protein [Rhodopirellula sp.]